VQAERNGYIRGVVKEIVHDSGRGEYPVRELGKGPFLTNP
jgi:hypothetical protein